jgi:ubiquitin carboxyl-terminal hydrolase 14
MASNLVEVKIKHAGKAYDVRVDLDQPGLAFKQQIFQLTGVDPAKVKVVVKGGMLKVSSRHFLLARNGAS